MTITISRDKLGILAEEAAVPGRNQLIAAIDFAPDPLTATSVVAADQLLSTYRVRLTRWEETGIPPSEGLPEFVSTLAAADTTKLVITSYETSDARFVLLFSEHIDQLLGCVVVSLLRGREGS
jgi:hypothetical protein